MDLDRAPQTLRNEVAQARTAALLAGRTVRIEGRLEELSVGDRVTFVTAAPTAPDNTRIEVTWELTGGGLGLRTRARATEPLRSSRVDVLRAARRRAAGMRDPVRRLRALPLQDALAMLAVPVGTRRPPGPCACCRRTAPYEADLDRSPVGLCFGCESWHRANAAAGLPDPGCAHAPDCATPGPRWWRADPRTDPDPRTNRLVVPAFRRAGLDVQLGTTGDFEYLHGEDGDDWIEATRYHASSRWEVTRKGAPWRGSHSTRPLAIWPLRDDVALHELVEAMVALAAGATDCPPQLRRA